jgi:8-oxo-dGTP diphosphatase
MDLKKTAIKTSVVACIIDQQERVLLTRRCIEPFCSLWVMPGGKIDHGEPILAALHREVEEEVGIKIHIDGLIDVYEHVNLGNAKDHFVILYYRVSPRSFVLAPNGTECTEARWFDKAELYNLPMPPGCCHILDKVFPDLMLPSAQPLEIDAQQEVPGEALLPVQPDVKKD